MKAGAVVRRASASPRRTQEERTEATRAKLIDAAVNVINEVGFTKATSLLISQRAQVSRGAFQHQFGTVQNLMLHIVEHLSSNLVGQIELETIRFASPTERLRAIATRYWTVYQSPQYRAVLLIWIGSAQDKAFVARIDDLMRSIDLQRDRNWDEIFGDLHIPKDELHTFRRMLLAMVRGLAIQTIYSRNRPDFQAALDSLVMLWKVLLVQRASPSRSGRNRTAPLKAA